MNCFDAQCFELFLYTFNYWFFYIAFCWVSMLNVLSFFFIFLLRHTRTKSYSKVSMLNVLSFFFINCKSKYWRRGTLVSMLNVLSFFFISMLSQIMTNPRNSFDAQCFELFLYMSLLCSLWFGGVMGFDAQCFELFLYSTLYNCNE